MRAAEVLVTWDLPTADLAEAAPNLRSGHLSGAVLDVFDPEPLPSRSPLWGVPNLVVTPHVWVMSVSALPMSIWPQAISYARPSSAVDLVSPVIACLVEVFGAFAYKLRHHPPTTHPCRAGARGISLSEDLRCRPPSWAA